MKMNGLESGIRKDASANALPSRLLPLRLSPVGNVLTARELLRLMSIMYGLVTRISLGLWSKYSSPSHAILLNARGVNNFCQRTVD